LRLTKYDFTHKKSGGLSGMKIKTIKPKNQWLLEMFFYTACLLFTALFVLSRGQDRNFDLLNYHFYQGYSLLNARYSVDIGAANLQSFLNPSVNLLAYLSLTHLPFPFSAWSILLIQITSIPAVVLLAKEVGCQLGYSRSFPPAIPAIILCLLSPAWASELGTTFFSSWTAPLVLWGVYLPFCSLKVSLGSGLRIGVAGILFGLATGLKLTNAPFAVAGFLMVVVLEYKNGWKNTILIGTYFLIACGIGLALTAWWNWHLWSVWGSPIFPLYNAIFKSEFFDFVNFRDMRWHFSSIADFIKFIVSSALGTDKTSEVLFADVRYLILFLLLTASFFCKPVIKLSVQLKALIVFMALSLLLWAVMFAYQRYLIPLELMLGLVIWILIVRIIESERYRKLFITGVTILAALFIKTPDWGHVRVPWGENNPFSIEMDAKFSGTPARYIVVGQPISYIIPSLHADSTFYGIGLSRQLDNLVYKKIAETSAMPTRILCKDTDTRLIPTILQKIGYSPSKQSLDCKYFRTGIGRYVISEVISKKSKLPDLELNADFSQNGFLKFGGVLWEQGLSFIEPWGRWSDGEQIEFGLSRYLPKGRLRLIMEAQAFGPNVGVPVKVIMDNIELTMAFSNVVTTQTACFENLSEYIDKIIIKIPNPTSPLKLGISGDTRKLGLGVVKLEIKRE